MLDLFADYSDKQSMKLVTPWSDFLTVKGIVTLKLRDGDGREIKTIGGNQVVYLGRHRLSRTICGDTTVAEKVVNTIKLAGGAVPDGGDHLNPTAVAVTDTGLFQTNAALIYTKNPVAATFNSVSGTTAPTASCRSPWPTPTLRCTGWWACSRP
jgi:hypothetical protein